MKLTPQTYQKMAEQASPPTKSRITIPSAFLIGGGICTLGEVFLNLFTRMGGRKGGGKRLGIHLPDLPQCPVHRAGLVRKAGKIRRCRHPGAHYGLCQRHGIPGAGVQDRGLRAGGGGKAVHHRRAGDPVRLHRLGAVRHHLLFHPIKAAGHLPGCFGLQGVIRSDDPY